MGDITSSARPTKFKGMSGYQKLVDILQRGNYASAAAAEYFMGRSPYRNLGEAIGAGITAKHRMTYGQLTGDPYSGLVLDIALDPTTWIPYGAIPRLIKATRLPAAIAKGATALGTKVPAIGAAAHNVSVAAKVLFTDPPYKAKAALGILRAEENLRKLGGVSDDLIKTARFGKLTDDILRTVPDAAKADLLEIHKGMNLLRGISSVGYDRKVIVDSAFRKYKPLARLYEKLEKTDPDKATAILDAFEYRMHIPKKVLSGGIAPYEGYILERHPKFIEAVKGMGLTDGDIASAVAKAKTKLANTIYDVPVLDELEAAVGASMKKTPVPNPYLIDEFNSIMDAAFGKLGPSYKKIWAESQEVFGVLAEQVASKKVYYRQVMDGFARRLGLGYVPHEAMDEKRYLRFLKKISTERAATVESKVGAAKVRLHNIILEASKKGDAATAKETHALLKKLDKFASDKLKDMFGGKEDFGEFMSAVRGAGQKIKSPELSAACHEFQRAVGSTFEDMRKIARTANDINKLSLDAGFGRVLETNLPKLLYAEEIKLRTVLLYHDFLDNMVSEFPNIIKVAKKGEKASENFVKVTSDILGDFFVHGDIADMFDGILRMQTGKSGELAQIGKYFDKLYSSTKYYMIIPFSKTALRNFVSSVSLTSLATTPREFAMEYMPALWRATKLWHRVKSGDKAAVEIYQSMLKNGLLEGFYRAELATTKGLTEAYPFALGLERLKPVKHVLGALSTGYDASEVIPRMAMYLFADGKSAKWFKKFGVKDAVELVRKFHPTYSKLTPFERRYMNRAFMFYSWSRHNIPLHVQMMAQNPGHYANIEKGRRAVTEILGGEEAEYYEPKYIREGYAVGVGGQRGKKNYFLLRSWLPEADLENITSLPKFRDLFAGMFNPLVKTPLESAFGYDMFKKQRMPRYPGERVPFYGLKIDPRIQHLFQISRVIQEQNRLWFDKTDPFMTKVMFAMVGKSYTVDIEKSKRYFKYSSGVMIGELEKGIERAKKENDYKTVKRLMASKQKVENSIKGL